MKTLHFKTCRKTKLLFSLLFCFTLYSNEPSPYNWAHQIREEVQPVPHYTELAETPEAPAPTVQSTEASEDDWPWGSPKNLLNPLPESKSSRPAKKAALKSFTPTLGFRIGHRLRRQ